MADLLDAGVVRESLPALTGWTGDHTGIARTFELPDFASAIALVDEVAVAAEEMDHHPDIDIRYRTVTFRCRTHSAGGVTDLDLRMAQAINDLAEEVD
ncbi:MAG TPA: 4a-hydroxytetrahydrobiopterin dehydratase [Pilimelia sp.]|nr:4a-hydroxytetrahydrobiopterin dehydratase [Pilimelia sp.]